MRLLLWGRACGGQRHAGVWAVGFSDGGAGAQGVPPVATPAHVASVQACLSAWKNTGMPRSNRRRREPTSLSIERALGGTARTESHPDGQWFVRSVAGSRPGIGGAESAPRRYLCPGCQQQFDGATAHVVAWPADGLGDLSDRRHWHTTCWRARDRRRPGGATR